MNDLVIHIGSHKTGSSALQCFLYRNADLLKEYGWSYPDLEPALSDVESFKTGKERNGIYFYKAWNQLDVSAENWRIAWNSILKELEKANVIISLEDIYLWDTQKFLSEAKKMYSNIKVLVYLRRQDRYIESWWNQTIKAEPYTTLPFQQYVDLNKNNMEYRYYDKLEQIKNIIGFENIIVRVYEKGQFQGEKKNIASDFLDALGIEPEWDRFKPLSYENERLYGNFLELKRIFNTVQKKEDYLNAWYFYIFMELTKQFHPEEKEEGYFTREQRIEFLNIYKEQNEKVARNYLHREEGVLFFDEKMDYPCYLTETRKLDMDMIRTFVCLNNENDTRFMNHKKEDDLQSIRIEQLREQNRSLAELVIDLYRKDKPLVYFGAGDNGKRLLEITTHEVKFIIDNDISKDGKSILDIPIINSKKVERWNDYFFLITCLETDVLEQQLQLLGLKKGVNYLLAKEIFGTLIKW